MKTVTDMKNQSQGLVFPKDNEIINLQEKVENCPVKLSFIIVPALTCSLLYIQRLHFFSISNKTQQDKGN